MLLPTHIDWVDDFQYHDLFTDATLMEKILDYKLISGADFEIRDKPSKPEETPSFLTHLYAYPVLTRHGEKMLFLKMNYAKYRASNCLKVKDFNGYLHFAQIAQDTREELVRYNLRLVVSIVKKRIPRSPNFSIALQGAISCGNMSLLKAIDKFNVMQCNKTGGTNKFSTYATHAIIRNGYRDTHGKKEVPISGLDVHSYPILDPNSIDANEGEVEVEKDSLVLYLEYLMNRTNILNPREKDILSKKFGFGGKTYTLGQIALIWGISKERVRQILLRSLNTLKDEFRPMKAVCPVLLSREDKPKIKRKRQLTKRKSKCN